MQRAHAIAHDLLGKLCRAIHMAPVLALSWCLLAASLGSLAAPAQTEEEGAETLPFDDEEALGFRRGDPPGRTPQATAAALTPRDPVPTEIQIAADRLRTRLRPHPHGGLGADPGRFAFRFDGETMLIEPRGEPEGLTAYRFLGLLVDGAAVPESVSSVPSRASVDRWLDLRRSDLLTERYEVLSAGVRQRFILHRDPAFGGGDVVISGLLDTTLQPRDASAAEGERLILGDGERAVLTLGSPVVSDAAGRDRLARLAVEGDRLSILLDRKWLEEAEYPVTVETLWAATQLSFTPDADSPAVAYNSVDDQYLVVWVEGQFTIQAALLDGAGGILQTGTILETPPEFTSRGNPAVGFARQGARWLVVWEDDRSGNDDIYGVVVESFRSSIATIFPPFPLNQESDDQRDPDVACSAATCLVVWEDEFNGDANNHSIDGTLIDTLTGDVSSTTAYVLTSRDEINPAVAFSDAGGRYLVIWQDDEGADRDIRAQVVDADGDVQDDLGNPLGGCNVAAIGTDDFDPDIAYSPDSDAFLIVWSRLNLRPLVSYTYAQVEGLTGTGCATLIDDFRAVSTPETDGEVRPKVSGGCTAGCFAVGILDEINGAAPYQLEINTVCFNGDVLDDRLVITSSVVPAGGAFDMAYGPAGEYLAVWPQDSGGSTSVYGQSFLCAEPGGAGGLGDPSLQATYADGQLTLTWEDTCNGAGTDYEVYEGALGDFYSHAPAACSTGGATTLTLAAPAGSAYYLVVPTDGTWEGSYGVDSFDVERPQGALECRPQSIGECL